MTAQEKITFKNRLKHLCESIIMERIDAAKLAIADAQTAANNEEKSSAGDKYETSRAMSHLEKDMQSRQLAENVKELATLHSIDVSKIYISGEPGAFLRCMGASFFIAAGLGKQIVETEIIYFLSPKAPLARLLYTKMAGEHFIFNQADITIVDVF